MEKKRVILITDGDDTAKAAVQHVANELHGYLLTQSAGNPTKLTGAEMVKAILEAPLDFIFVLFDDCGHDKEGPGESALKTVVHDSRIETLGALAVASHSFDHEWTRVDVSIDRLGRLTPYGVDKSGIQELELERIRGDTVYLLDQLNIPIVIGIGDIGKMGGRDDPSRGAPITRRAVDLILERSGGHVR
ncbi:stage V sporulation protein AE [Texcoconibacillus texcoconensis]|uniref:Stage V sporulation protein AE n=1 Tax=Texcoconibacillus texcoconensis TaxID=1095777 RepID=A0A840QNP7_9BACI|nr:stage V sporulation protein AE [Texcoconibacillus texcoconensis]MBB5172978.1 stage V sporulation protein AE [Texcoconibacillus texcoconensis]